MNELNWNQLEKSLTAFWKLVDTSLFYALWVVDIDHNGDRTNLNNIQAEKFSLLLKELNNEEFLKMYAIWNMYINRAYISLLWDAASLMSEYAYLWDDWFVDFRSWLIMQGEVTYEDIVNNPDNLADLDEEDRKEAIHNSEILWYWFSNEFYERSQDKENFKYSRRDIPTINYYLPEFKAFIKTKAEFKKKLPKLSLLYLDNSKNFNIK